MPAGCGGEEAFLLLHRLTRPVVASMVEVGDLPVDLVEGTWPGDRIAWLHSEAYRRLLRPARARLREHVGDGPHGALARWRSPC